ncbi:MAG: beta-propeller domain-containing protein [Pseudomonadota bacterium]
MAGRSGWIAAALVLLAATPAAAQRAAPSLKPLPAYLTSPVLETFANEAEFRRYVRDVRREAKKRDMWWAMRGGPIQVAQNQDVPCTDPNPENCPGAASEGSIIVTGSRVAAPASITNVQVAGVDEGDIVKQIGRFLLVLQDGRIFSIDTGGNGLALVDRVNVYRDADAGGWYDEMLVQDDHVIITGYSYGVDATEVSVFRLSPAGKLASEGVFQISSNDYYDVENYATRIVGDQLVVYSPVDISNIDLDEPIAWPVVRRWQPEREHGDAVAKGAPMFDAKSIYKPIQPTIAPVIHTVSMCPIGPVGKGRDLRCHTTAMVGPSNRTFYVSPTDVYLWTTPGWNEYDAENDGDCDEWSRRAPADAHPAALFRIPISGREPTAMHTLGGPSDQFSFDVSGGHFHGLVRWLPIRCGKPDKEGDPASNFYFFDTPLARLSAEPAKASRADYVPLPAIGTEQVENRFTGAYVVYGGHLGWSTRPPDEKEEKTPLESRAVAVPIKAPAQASILRVPHNVIRIERVGDDIVMTGYRDSKGLSVSAVDLSGAPRLASTAVLDGRYESEGRSHAFNSLPAPGGSALMGLPTVHPEGDADRWWWYSAPSDVSFLAMDAGRQVRPIGELSPGKDAVDPDYKCEVSCIDWYGNSRPIFTGGRIFALSGTELIEGRVEGGKMVELRRLNLSKPLKP